MKRKLKKILLISFALITLIAGGGILYVYYWISDWSGICTKEEMKFNAENLNNTKSLPTNFYYVWDKLFPDSRSVSMTEQSMGVFLHEIGLQKGWKDCKCDEIGYSSWNNHGFKWKYNHAKLLQTAGYMKFGFGLNEFATPEKCFDFWINNDFYYRIERRYFKGLEEFSNILFKKKIVELTDEEIVTIIVYRMREAYPPYQDEGIEEVKKNFMTKFKKASI